MKSVNLICFPDSTGKVDALGPLVSRLPAAVQALGLERRRGGARPRTVGDLAADYLRRLRGLQPSGPWYLAGWSFGGNLAYEAARQLEADGQAVGLLVLIDSEPPGSQAWPALYRQSLQAIGGLGDGAEEVDLERLVQVMATLGAPRDAIDSRLPASIRDAIPPTERNDPARYSRALGTILDHVRLLADYQPVSPIHPSRAVCISASRSGPMVVAGWAAWLCGDIQYQEVVGDHRSILRAPAVEQTAGTINTALFGLN